jgi:thioredoxin reductase (NADPH)
MFPVLYEGYFSGVAGGQLMTTTEVENYPGFPEGITGPLLMDHCKKQAERFGTTIISEDVISVDLQQTPFIIKGQNTELKADAVIIATGATANRLPIPGTGDGELWQRGVTACAVCDGAAPIFRNKDLYVIGGGDSAMEEAMFLTKYASKVFIVHRRDTFRASRIMAERAIHHPKIEVLWNSEIVKVEGDKVVESVTVKNLVTHQEEKRHAAGVFFAVGHTPNTAFLNGQLKLLPTGYIEINPGTTETSIPGVFAAGDVQDARYKQAITAAGSGCMAALDAEKWLQKFE